MKLIKIQIIKFRMKLAKWKLRYFKFINSFKYIFNWFLFLGSLIIRPKKLFRYLKSSTVEFFKNLSLVRLSTINIKAVMIFATIMLLVSGAGWAFGRGIEAQGTTPTTSANNQELSGLDWYVGGGDLTSGMLPALVRTLNTSLVGIGTGYPEGTIVSEDPNFKEMGLIRAIGQVTKYTYVKPISGGEYIADLKQKINPNQTAYAQSTGLGYQYLKPIYPLWATFRNIALSFIAIILVVFGFIIMVGQKVGTVSITIANAIPAVIMTLVLIIFSYPIVGFMVDIAETANIYIYNILCEDLKDPNGIKVRTCVGTNAAGQQQDPLHPQGPFSFSTFSGTRPVNIFTLIQGLNKTENVEKAVSDIVDQILSTITGSGVGKTAGDIVSGIVKLVFFLAVISAMFKTFFGLLSAYIGIILKTILSPIQLLMVALPGGNTFTSWIKGIMADILVFPATFGALVITAVLMGNILSTEPIWMIKQNISGAQSLSWFPMPLGRFVDPNTGIDVVASLLGFGMLLFLPSIPGLIKGALKSSDMTGGATQQVAGQIKGIASQIPFVGGFVR